MIVLYFESSKTHTSYSNTQKIFMDIFVTVVVKKNHLMQEMQRNTFHGLNVTLVACGNILNALKVKMFQMQTGFGHITAKSWMMWLNTKNI